MIELPVISPGRRKDERQLEELRVEMMPAILGGIYNVLADILLNLSHTQLKRKPRMADFCLWVTAGEGRLNWKPGTFVTLFDENCSEAIEQAFECDSFALAISEKLKMDPPWVGSWERLLSCMSDSDLRPRGWPQTPQGVASKLKRLAPALRHAGIEYSTRRIDNKRTYKFWRTTNAA